MKAQKTTITNRNRGILHIVLGTAFILMIPFVAMQFTDEVSWGVTDFIIIGALLFGTGLVYELVVRRLQNTKHRVIFGIVLAAALLLVWAELAVGIFGSPFSGQ